MRSPRYEADRTYAKKRKVHPATCSSFARSTETTVRGSCPLTREAFRRASLSNSYRRPENRTDVQRLMPQSTWADRLGQNLRRCHGPGRQLGRARLQRRGQQRLSLDRVSLVCSPHFRFPPPSQENRASRFWFPLEQAVQGSAKRRSPGEKEGQPGLLRFLLEGTGVARGSRHLRKNSAEGLSANPRSLVNFREAFKGRRGGNDA